MLDYKIEIINDRSRYERLIERLVSVPVFALDIETVDWWNRHQERIALIQVAYRAGQEMKVAIIDAFAKLDFETLRKPFELDSAIKAIHNAAFDASRLAVHYRFQVAPIYDTMAAARRSGERKYSLKAQAESHLGLNLNKNEQRSDWSRRPLDTKQIHYAALDAVSTLLLYEHQSERKLNGAFQLKAALAANQSRLPLTELKPAKRQELPDAILPIAKNVSLPQTDLSKSALALLGVITELPGRYSPAGLAVSAGTERVGLAGWIIDRVLGREADLEEDTVKMEIADLCGRGMIEITPSRRLESTVAGSGLWHKLKPEM